MAGKTEVAINASLNEWEVMERIGSACSENRLAALGATLVLLAEEKKLGYISPQKLESLARLWKDGEGIIKAVAGFGEVFKMGKDGCCRLTAPDAGDKLYSTHYLELRKARRLAGFRGSATMLARKKEKEK